ncbi:hypothetical protein QUA82_16280 [Microcoleus sp. F8-D3]
MTTEAQVPRRAALELAGRHWCVTRTAIEAFMALGYQCLENACSLFLQGLSHLLSLD